MVRDSVSYLFLVTKGHSTLVKIRNVFPFPDLNETYSKIINLRT